MQRIGFRHRVEEVIEDTGLISCRTKESIKDVQIRYTVYII